VTPTEIMSLMAGSQADAVMTALLPMKTIDVAALRAATGLS
jgi:predicted 3-demethylubiquinone-9 3-methyltransferase (glyoxalase superfamily)